VKNETGGSIADLRQGWAGYRHSKVGALTLLKQPVALRRSDKTRVQQPDLQNKKTEIFRQVCRL
jgi:hypothetical protein